MRRLAAVGRTTCSVDLVRVNVLVCSIIVGHHGTREEHMAEDQRHPVGA